jgi:tetratricopeptide (TPR) repeat protein
MKHFHVITVSFLIILSFLFTSCATGGSLAVDSCRAKIFSSERNTGRLLEKAESWSQYKSSISEKRNAFSVYSCLVKRDSSLAVHLGRTLLFLAGEEDEIQARRKYASYGAEISLHYYKQKSSPELAYYFAANKGLELQYIGLAALKQLPIVLTYLDEAMKKPSIDQGGPCRALAMIRIKAPGKYQNIQQALSVMKKGVNLFPSHPLNHVIYARALIEDGMDDEAVEELKKAEEYNKASLWGTYYSEQWKLEIQKLRGLLEE